MGQIKQASCYKGVYRVTNILGERLGSWDVNGWVACRGLGKEAGVMHEEGET